MLLRALIVLMVSCFLSPASSAATLDPMTETRYGVPPVRHANGDIKRSAAVYKRFREQNACPSTGFYWTATYKGSCPGYEVNHDRALACGGVDAVFNMSYMRLDVKRLHDSYERKIQGRGILDTAACSPPPIGGIK